ncbi:hypothetical protein, partial [Niabella aquatica]
LLRCHRLLYLFKVEAFSTCHFKELDSQLFVPVYDEFEEITGLEHQTIKDYKYVSENVSSLRHDDLSFSSP